MPKLRELKLRWGIHPSGTSYDTKQISQPRDAAAILIPMLEGEPQEVGCILM